MRIVAGRLKGKKLQSPAGDTTRPTADRAREGLFNILAHGRFTNALRGSRVADLFAGSGSVGLEAISRGAASCRFYENDPAVLRALQANIRACRQEDSTEIRRENAFAPRPVREPCNLVFLDPPYAEGAVSKAMVAAIKAGLVTKDGLLITQSHPKDTVSTPDGMQIVADRQYGAARFFIFAWFD